MKISLDVRESVALADDGTVGQAYEAGLQHANRMGRTVLDLRLDGKLVATDGRDGLLESPVEGFGEMMLETVDTAELVLAAVDDAACHLQPCREALESAHTLVESGQYVRALQTLKPTFEVWMSVCEAVTKAAILLGVDLSSALVEDVSIESAQMLVVGVLDRAGKIFESKNWKALGDLIRFQLIPLVGNWERICEALEERSRAQMT